MFFDTSFLKSEEIRLVLERVSDGDPVRKWVPAYYFAICDLNGNKMGSCDLRIGHNEMLYYGGNIGYRVEEPFRGNRYAAKACRLLFELARKHQLEYLIITCNPDNLPSRKTIEAVGGKLLEIVPLPADSDMRTAGDREKCIFRIDL
ncbi:MAG: GNAT family N-acetyltransferase [Oscillospiraceae bacterium]|nr:GNAT family N-acetyltransferase [Oscillospiraceae bacterium]